MLVHDSWDGTLLQRHLTKKIHRILRLSTKEKEEVGEGGVSDKKKENQVYYYLLLLVVVVVVEKEWTLDSELENCIRFE